MRHCQWHHMGLSLLFSLSLLLALPTGGLAGEIYKWTDEEGKVHFGDKPGASGAEQLEIKQQSPAPRARSTSHAERLEKQQRLLDVLGNEREVRANKAKKKKEARAQRKRNCKISENNLARYKASTYVYDYDKNGERRILPDTARQGNIDTARKNVNKYCG